MPVFHRVVMNVIHVSREIFVVANNVFPEAALPDAAFAFRDAARRQSLLFGQRTTKFGFDGVPASRKIRVAFRQCPDAMQMIGKDHRCVDREGALCLYGCKCPAQSTDVFDQQPPLSLQQGDREEERTARNVGADISRHGFCAVVGREKRKRIPPVEMCHRDSAGCAAARLLPPYECYECYE